MVVNSSSHEMPIGVLSNQTAALWLEYCAALQRLEQVQKELEETRRQAAANASVKE